MAAIRRRQSGAGGNASIMSSGPVKGAQDSQTDVKEKPWTTRVCRATSLSQWRCGARVAVPNAASFRRQRNALQPSDRKSVVQGKSVSVRVDLGGRRIIKKKKQTSGTNKQNRNKQCPKLISEYNIQRQ